MSELLRRVEEATGVRLPPDTRWLATDWKTFAVDAANFAQAKSLANSCVGEVYDHEGTWYKSRGLLGLLNLWLVR